MSLTKKLNLYKKQIIRNADNTKEHKAMRDQQDDSLSKLNENNRSIPYLDDWVKAGASPYYYEDQWCFIKEVRYPLHYQHGKYKLSDFLQAIDLWNQFSIHHPLSAKSKLPSDLFFFDTETTGLRGGTGNVIFLLGHAQVVDDELILKQHFLPEPGYEVALYKSFLEIVDYTTLVTYNGKAFDWPQVKTRHTLVRDHVPKLPSFGHFDLYHAARRMWKHLLESVKLVNVETEILGVNRKDDIPGYLAPIIYFDYIERKNPEAIFKILQHNELDILSLVTLYTHLTFQIFSVDPKQTEMERTLIGKWYDYLGNQEKAMEFYEIAASKGERSAKHFLAFHLKRAGNYQKAKELWLEVAEGGSDSIQSFACIELAKLFEHQYKDPVQAISYTKKALLMNQTEVFQRDAQKRLARLYRKLQSIIIS